MRKRVLENIGWPTSHTNLSEEEEYEAIKLCLESVQYDDFTEDRDEAGCTLEAVGEYIEKLRKRILRLEHQFGDAANIKEPAILKGA